jgi:Family of unknown function (DUF6161)
VKKAALFQYLEQHRSGDIFRKQFESRDELQHYAGQQAGRWVSLIESAKTSLQRTLPPSELVANMLYTYQQSISQKFMGMYSAQQSGGIALDSRIPLLDEIADDAPDGDAWTYVGAIVFWLSEFALVSGQIQIGIFSDPRIQRGIAEVAASSSEHTRLLNGSVRSADKLLENAQSTFDQKLKLVDAAISKAREDGLFAEARTLWQQEASHHTKSYGIAFLVMAAGVILLVLAIRYDGVRFWGALPKNQNTGEYTYLASFVVGIAFLAFAWIFRLIGRFVMESFALAADARLRQTILVTFLNLVGTAEAHMSEGERVLILTALFRPAPGQGADHPTAATLLQLARDATKAVGR